MKSPRQCPLVLLVRRVEKKVRQSKAKKAETKGGGRREVDHGHNAFDLKSEFIHKPWSQVFYKRLNTEEIS